MPRKKKTKQTNNNTVKDYRFEKEKRKNIPPSGLATYDRPREEKKTYCYDPHLDPQLIWTDKAGLKNIEWEEGKTNFDVDVVSLHIHERVSTKAIIDAVRKKSKREEQLALFAEPELPLDRLIEFYRHDVNWSNRLILGDSLLVANSLLVRESMAGKVQMIYVDPPYGIKYSSNFQPRIDRKDVKDKDEDLTREPEQIKAYRDTWKLGIHSYLTYLRDRFLLCKDLMHPSGSIFVQISDENLHLVRCLMDEVFGRENFVAIIAFRKKRMPLGAELMDTICDFLLWYCKNKEMIRYRKIFVEKIVEGDQRWNWVETPDQIRRKMTRQEINNYNLLPEDSRIFLPRLPYPAGFNESCVFPVSVYGKQYKPPPGKSWVTNKDGMNRLVLANRIVDLDEELHYVLYFDDYPVTPLTHIWMDVALTGIGDDKLYAVQTATKVIERCILMTTDPGDLVLDPTCGSGTTAFCSEKWGRRWITCDTSRVALAIARQRILTAVYPYYELFTPEKGPGGGFIYETVPHITLESIAHNPGLDPDKVSERCERFKQVNSQASDKEIEKLLRKEIDELIRKNATQEVLYDKPKIEKKKIRVSGPFSVEAIPVPVIEETTQPPVERIEEGRIADMAGDHITNVIELLRKNGVIFPKGKLTLENIRPLRLGMLHAEADISEKGKKRVAISIGPQYGPVTSMQVDEAVHTANANAYDILIFAGFSFDPEAHAFIQKVPLKNLQVHFANISPDVLVGDLLKTTRSSQLFTVFGQPDIEVKQKESKYTVELRGVDIYDPNTGELHQSRGEDVATWFLDTDYDGKTFHICQAFFPGGENAWEKIQRALKGVIEPEIFEQLCTTTSLPFETGENKRIAVKVIDFRGNEVICVHKLGD